MLLTVTRPVAAEGLDLGPLCEDRRWWGNHSGSWVDGGLQSLPAVDKKDTRHSCHLKSQRLKCGGKACVFYKEEDKHMQICTQTHARVLLHVWLLVASLKSKKLWYCQVWAVYLSLKWSQAARNSLKEQLGKIQGEQVHSSLAIPYPLPYVFVWAAQLACLMFIFYFSHTIMFGHTQGPPLLSPSTSVKFYLIDFRQFRLVNPPSLSCLAYCADVRPCCRHCLS